MQTQQCFNDIIHNYQPNPNGPIIVSSPYYPQYGFIVEDLTPISKKSSQYNMQANPLPEVHQISGDESIFTGPGYYMNFVPFGNPYFSQPKYPGFVYQTSRPVSVMPVQTPKKHHLILLILIIIVILLIYKLR